jgi:ferric-dicitrate binding protein FerR (iron transport regulator)
MSDAGLERARQEAMAWWVRLDTTSITNQALQAFADWRRRPDNEAAYEQVEREAKARAAKMRQDRG